MHRIFLIAASLFVAWGMHFELIHPGLYMDDGEFHLSVLKALDQAFQNGRNPLDFWFSGTPFGFALFRSYQSLPYLLMYSAFLILGKYFSLATILSCSNFILAMVLPWSVYFAMKLFRFSDTDAVISGVASIFISDGGEFGFGLQYYTFGNNGLFTQLWAIVFLPLALGFAYRFISEGVFFGWAILFSFLTFGCHVICAFILLFSFTVFLVFKIFTFDRLALRRGLFFVVILGFVTSYQWLFAFLDAPYINQSLLEPAWKYEGHGILYVLQKIVSGDSIDFERFPTLTILMLIGLASSLWGYGVNEKGAQPLQRIFVSCLILFITLYAGREIWGWLFTDMPALKSLHMHRFAIGYHLFAIFLIGIGGGVLLREAGSSRRAVEVILVLLLASSVPLVSNRMKMYSHAGSLRIAADAFFKTYTTPYDVVKALEPGIVYAGANHNWQKEIAQFGIPMHFFATAAGFPTVGGALYHAFALSGETLFDFDVKRKAHFELYGIKTILAPADWTGMEGFTKENTYQNISVWSTKGGMLSLGKATFTLCGERAKTSPFLRKWVQSPLVEAKQYGILTLKKCGDTSSLLPEFNYIDAPPLPKGVSEVGKVISEEPYLPWRSSGKIFAGQDDMIILATSFHPNWVLNIDGKTTNTSWITPGFIGAQIPAGEHEVTFEYQGSSTKTVLFFLGVLGIFASFWLSRAKEIV